MVFQILRTSAMEMVILTFIIALGAILLGYTSGLGKSITASNPEATAVNAGLTALNTYSSYFGIIVIAIIFVAIIGIVLIVANAGKSAA